MIPAAILLFLIVAVMAWVFRVWILVPITLLAITAAVLVELWLGASLLAAFGYGLVIGLSPQLGYAFGLLARNTLLGSRSPLMPRSSREASVAMLYKQGSTNQTQ
jgi:hypothetical protein